MKTVTIPFFDLTKRSIISQWAQENCPSYQGYDLHVNDEGNYNLTLMDYTFYTDKDAAWFALRWL